MNRLEIAAVKLKQIDAFSVASICSSLIVLLEGSRSTLKSLDHIRWAENRLFGARDSLMDLGMNSQKTVEIRAYIEDALAGIEEIRKGIAAC